MGGESIGKESKEFGPSDILPSSYTSKQALIGIEEIEESR